MATQNVVGPWLLRQVTAVTAAEAAPTTGFRNPGKGQWNIPGRLAGWEDVSLARILCTPVTVGGTVTACEVTVLQKKVEAYPAVAVLTLVLDVASNLFKPQPGTLGPVGPGGYAVYISKLSGTTPSVTFGAYLEGFNSDGNYAP